MGATEREKTCTRRNNKKVGAFVFSGRSGVAFLSAVRLTMETAARLLNMLLTNERLQARRQGGGRWVHMHPQISKM